jgi:hypothetical protein
LQLEVLNKFLREKETSAARYSNTAAKYTGAPAPTLVEYFPAFKNLAILPTGNCSPALVDRDMAFFPELFPLPDMVTDPRNFLFPPKPQCTGEEEWGTKTIFDNANGNGKTRPRRFPQRRRSATKSRKTGNSLSARNHLQNKNTF